MRLGSSLVVVTFVLHLGVSHAQQPAVSVSQVLQEMNSAHWQERSRAFDSARELLDSAKLTPAERDKLKLAIVQLLVRENGGGLKASESVGANGYSVGYGEEKSEYYPGLIGFVATLDDQRAIPALLGAATTGGMATRGMARFGRNAVGPTVAQVRGTDAELARGGVNVIREILEMRTAQDPDLQLQIKGALEFALQSASYRVREAAIFAIEYFSDREEFVPMLEDIAEHDPYRSDYTLGKRTPGQGAYQVRHMAQLLLQKIASHDQPIIDRGSVE